MNWGWKIAIAYLAFVGLILFMVFLSVSQKIELESEDYYAQELEYQNQIKKEKNAIIDKVNPVIDWISGSRQVKFFFENQADQVAGNIYFYRPSDKSLDFFVPVSLDTMNVQWVASDKLIKGLWEVRLDWTSGSEGYYYEERIFID